MDLTAFVQRLRSGDDAKFPRHANTLGFARKLDAQDQLRHLRDEFVLPTKASLKKKALDGSFPDEMPLNSTKDESSHSAQPCLYFVGNSLGAQPKAVREYVAAQLETWASIGVNGHFTDMGNSPLTQWQDMAEQCAKQSADIVGASPHEIVIMNTLTINLHLMMASFYKPSGKRHKIILEWKPFPSDHYAIESQVVWHGLDPKTSMIKIEPDANSVIPTESILRTIDEHADETALLMLPGIQYYSGQLFDMPRITAYAKQRGITVGWDLAHAAGNVELKLHEWDVDFACWCTYKYINAGPGAIGGVYVHERFGKVEWPDGGGPKPSYRPRLMGWYGGDKSVRFNMDNNFVPTPGAAGYQLSNPSALDLAALSGALSVFNKTTMHDIRSKSLVMTAYAEFLLDQMLDETKTDPTPLFTILTPRDPLQRGTQLSVLLRDGLLEKVTAALEEHGAICDKRKPNVIRVAPVPLYTRFEDVWAYVQILRRALGLEASSP
ncbi:Kynureninase 1 [Claviceps africana]|uniref:Kynureninase n=1 Tax=Claviceps africana TaxID=83212 RepID=A0A8K0JE56_9HYPO|nr:Kynureninase 1 [Claviceps africana]